jgi:ribonuclease HI
MRFKNNKVWQATEPNGKPIAKNGKVLIKYQLNQDYEYWVHEKGVTPLDGLQPAKKDAEGKKKSRGPLTPHCEKRQSDLSENANSDNPDAIRIHTDGASSGNPGPSGIGVLLQYGQHEKEISKYIGFATNNIAELEAIRTGLGELKDTHLPVRVFTDSKYACGVLTLGWKARQNQALIRSLKKTMSKFSDLKLIKVKGHAGMKENERADHLATSAIKEATAKK